MLAIDSLNKNQAGKFKSAAREVESEAHGDENLKKVARQKPALEKPE
jgi:hypothetical protein